MIENDCVIELGSYILISDGDNIKNIANSTTELCLFLKLTRKKTWHTVKQGDHNIGLTLLANLFALIISSPSPKVTGMDRERTGIYLSWRCGEGMKQESLLRLK